MNYLNLLKRPTNFNYLRPVAIVLLAVSLVTLTGFSIGSRRIRSSGCPFDFKINSLVDGRSVIIFLVDGARADLLYKMADSGELPSIKKYFINRGVTAEHAVTSVPSITNAAIAAMTCGAYPGHVNIVGNRWFDRIELKRINLVSLRNYYLASEFLNRETIYQILKDQPTVTVATPCNRGSQCNIHLHYNLAGMSNYLFSKWNKVDKVFIQEFQDVVEYANREGVFPSVTFFHLPGMDFTSHSYGPFSKEARSILKNVDESLGELMKGLEKNGVIDKICVLLVADHGQVPMEKGNYFLWEDYFSKCFNLPILSRYGEKDEYFTRALGMQPVSRYDDIDEEKREKRERYYNRFAVIEGNNGRNAFLYFRHNPAARWINPKGMTSWAVRPTWKELRNYHSPKGRVDLVEEMRLKEGVAFVVGRPRKGEVAIFSRNGEGLIRTKTFGNEVRYAYKVVKGEDPLGYISSEAAAGLMDGDYHSSRKWLEATCSLKQTDVVAQLPSLFESPYCGDLFVIPSEGWDFEKANIGGHGGFLQGEMRVPLLVAGPRIKRGRLVAPVRTVDIVPTILDYLGFGDRIEGLGLDGKSFWNEIRLKE